jgi:hypothetical protein
VGSRGGGPAGGLSAAISGAMLRTAADRTLRAMSLFWIWTQAAVVVFVLIGIVIAITKLA